MRFPHQSRMSVTRRQEKDLRLDAFVARGLGALTQRAVAVQEAPYAITAIARSVRSPVVKAIATHARAIAAVGGTLRLLLARPDGLGTSGALAAVAAAALACEVRLARNPRLIEAHEQLTIGARVAWTGDTMRRDPATSDAYECFVEDCPEIAAAAAATFERLWGDCAPLAEGAPAAAAGAQDAAGAGVVGHLATTLPTD
jgi:hypothetical protein